MIRFFNNVLGKTKYAKKQKRNRQHFEVWNNTGGIKSEVKAVKESL